MLGRGAWALRTLYCWLHEVCHRFRFCELLKQSFVRGVDIYFGKEKVFCRGKCKYIFIIQIRLSQMMEYRRERDDRSGYEVKITKYFKCTGLQSSILNLINNFCDICKINLLSL
jgi:hypothetical protein